MKVRTGFCLFGETKFIHQQGDIPHLNCTPGSFHLSTSLRDPPPSRREANKNPIFGAQTDRQTKFIFVTVKTIATRLPTRRFCPCPYGAQKRARDVHSDTHQRANQIDKIGAAAKFQSAFLPGTGENDPFHRIHGSRKIRAGQLIGAEVNLQGCLLLFWNFFLVGQEKSASFPLGRGSVTPP